MPNILNISAILVFFTITVIVFADDVFVSKVIGVSDPVTITVLGNQIQHNFETVLPIAVAISVNQPKFQR